VALKSFPSAYLQTISAKYTRLADWIATLRSVLSRYLTVRVIKQAYRPYGRLIISDICGFRHVIRRP
jgi:hypothetical protein